MKISTDNSAIRKTVGDIEAMRLIRNAGFDGIDYSFYGCKGKYDILAMDDGERAEMAERIRDYAKIIGLEFPQCHAELKYTYGTIEIGEENPMYRRVIRSMEYAAGIGCKKIVIHDMKCPLDMDDETADNLNYEFMRSFLPYAEKYGLIIGVENLFKHDKEKDIFIGRHHTAEWMNEFVDRLGSSLYEVCVDIGHAEICGTPSYELIGGLSSSRLTMLHVQDTDLRGDRHWMPYMGMHDWDKITSALAEIGFGGTMNFEILHYHDKFTPDLWPAALKLSADVARKLASEVERKKLLIS